MIGAAEMIAIAREPSVRFLANGSRKWNRENPRDEFPFRQNIEQLLDRGRALPRCSIARANEL